MSYFRFFLLCVTLGFSVTQAMVKENADESKVAACKKVVCSPIEKGSCTLLFTELLERIFDNETSLDELCEFLLRDGVDVNDPLVLPCHRAVAADRIDVLALLVANDGDVNMAQHGTLLRPLHCAIRYCATEAPLLFLLRQGADPHVRDTFGAQPIHYAVDYANIPCISALWEYGVGCAARIKSANKQSEMAGYTSLHIFVQPRKIKTAKNRGVMRVLLSLGLSIDSMCARGNTVLACALLHGVNDISLDVIAYGADISMPGKISIPRVTKENAFISPRQMRENKRRGLSFLRLLRSVLAKETLDTRKAHRLLKSISISGLFCISAGQGALALLYRIVVGAPKELKFGDYVSALYGATAAGHRAVTQLIWEYINEDTYMQPSATYWGNEALVLAAAQRREDVFVYLIGVRVPVHEAGRRLRRLARHESYSDEARLHYQRMYNALADRQRLRFALGRDFFFQTEPGSETSERGNQSGLG